MSQHHSRHPANDNADDTGYDDNFLEHDLKLAQHGVELVKMEGRVFLRFSGAVRVDGLHVDYRLVPARGVLAKPSKWRKMDLGARRALIEERATRDAIDDLNQEVEEFVRDIADQCEEAGFDPMLFLHVLKELETSEPAEYVFERIHQRLEHAIEREIGRAHV